MNLNCERCNKFLGYEAKILKKKRYCKKCRAKIELEGTLEYQLTEETKSVIDFLED